MFDLLKRTLLAGVGMGLMTVDKVEELAREIAKSAQLSADKGQEFVDEAVARAQQGRKTLETTVQRYVDEAVRRANLVTRDDLNRVLERLERLEQAGAARPE